MDSKIVNEILREVKNNLTYEKYVIEEDFIKFKLGNELLIKLSDASLSKTKTPFDNTDTEVNSFTNGNSSVDLELIKAEAKIAVDNEFNRKYGTGTLDDLAFLKSFRSFCVLTRNTYVNSVKKQNKELGDALKGYSVSSLNEGIFSRIKDGIMGVLGRKQKEIEVIEKKVDDTLGVAANKILKSQKPLAAERRDYMTHQAEIIKDIIVKKLADFVTTVGSGLFNTKDSNYNSVAKSLNNDKKSYVSNIKNTRQNRRINELDKPDKIS